LKRWCEADGSRGVGVRVWKEDAGWLVLGVGG
jgi:hypothetical protein